jgi:hypothetical protein
MTKPTTTLPTIFLASIVSIAALSVAGRAAEPAPASSSSSSPQRMPTVTSVDSNLLQEERPVDETGRPEWTSARRFTTTRVYIQKAPWEVGIEQWWRYRYKRDNSSISRLSSEIEIGLPYRMQLDLYYDHAVDGDGHSRAEDFAVELRYAFADWGKIPLNPTVYAEYKFAAEGPDVFEGKILLGDQIAGGWHYGINFVWEQQLSGERECEYQIVAGISKTILDGKLSAGLEIKYDNDTVKGGRGDAEDIFLWGPSVQWRPTENFHIDMTALIGANDESPRQECYLILGYDFGRKDSEYHPISGRR